MLEAYSEDAREKASQEEPFTFCCDECGHEIQPGERYYRVMDWIVCEECIYNNMRIY